MKLPDEVAARLERPVREMTRENWEAAWAATGVPAYYFDPLFRFCGRWYFDGLEHRRLVEWLHTSLATDYFNSLPVVYELGCGPGVNLLRLRGLFPAMRLAGLDWAQSAVDAVKAQGISARVFDMTAPDGEMEPESGVLTAGALEQLGTNFSPVFGWLLEQKPSVVVHVEPLYELYHEHDPFDQVAMRWHDRRGYLKGYLPAVRDAARDGKVEILECRRTFGGMMHDGYSVLVWRPL